MVPIDASKVPMAASTPLPAENLSAGRGPNNTGVSGGELPRTLKHDGFDLRQIQRIGQVRSEIWIANLRYRNSVEDRVHQVLAERLEAIHGLFGQIPDTLEDVWVHVALHNEQAAQQLIDRTTATRNPFDVKYSKVEDADWETCTSVLNGVSMKELLSRGW